jgi:DNA (cytosine-5)-methyltransferase 1
MNNFPTLREKAGLSIQDVADLTGYSLRTVYRWENENYDPKKLVLDKISKIADPGVEYKKSENNEFTFIDLFAGIGGMRIGFEEIGGKCVFTSEWDKFCRQTYSANFPIDHEIAGDIKKVDEEDIPDHDVLLAGFPCQPFSIAGVSKKNSLGHLHGFEDKIQGTLFFDIARILKHHQPPVFMLENVKNLTSHDGGNTFEVIKETLIKLGYKIDWRVINAKPFVPQNRERIFIVGFKSDNGFEFDELELPKVEDGPKMKNIFHPEDGSEATETPYTLGENAVINDKYTLSDKLWTYLQEYAEKHRRKGNGFGYGMVGPEDTSRTLSARYYKDGSEILIRQKGNPRRLTPRECSRLMGFDRFQESNFKIPVSDTQAYQQFAKASIVPVVKAIASYMYRYILETKGDQLNLFTK